LLAWERPFMTKKFFVNSACLAFLFLNCAANLSATADITIRSAKPAEDTRSNKEKYARPVNAAQTQASSSLVNEEKMAQLQPINQQYLQDLKVLRPQIKAKKEALKTLLKENTLDLQSLETLNAELYELKKQEGQLKIRYQYEISRILTPEERKGLKLQLARQVKAKRTSTGKNLD
jgi:Spy/CpxP family protein refolding chaperone